MEIDPLEARPSGVPEAVLARLRRAVGPRGYTEDPAEIAPLCVSWRDNWRGWTPMAVRPASTTEVAEVVRICAETGTPIVPQGGNTGMTGASQPHGHGREIILSTSRLRAIRALDLANDTITVEAGCILAEIQAKAAAVGRLFPLSLGAEGTCQIGGNLSTNAGGVQVLRYGNVRNLVLGLEVVLPDGRVWNGLRGLRKDNTGYDLKQLFIGAEGTLGIVTAAVLKLFPRPHERITAFAAIAALPAALELLSRCRTASGDAVTSFELIPRLGLDLALRHVAGITDPLAARHAHYLLIELSASAPGSGLRERLEGLLAQALADGLVRDATLADSEAAARRLWRVREAIVEAERAEGASVKHDVSVPVSRVPRFIELASRRVEDALPGVRPMAFGHLGDGNVHFNLIQPADADPRAFLDRRDELSRIVHDTAVELGGSISAEHGLGRLKRDEIRRYKPAVEIELMRRIKTALDPDDIMNPGKVV